MLKTKQNLSFAAAVLSAVFIWTFAAAPTAFAADFPCGSTTVYNTNGASYKVFFLLKNSPPQCEAARDSLSAAAVIVTDGESESKIYDWAKTLFADPQYAAKFNDNLKFGDAVSWLKARISTDGMDRLFMIDNAFQEVYGRNSVPLEQVEWDSQVKAQKSWYAPIVLAEAAKLNSNPGNRLAVINSAYDSAFGRSPNEQEIGYWKSRKEHFRLMLNAHRNYLYSSGGAQERSDMLTRFYKSTNKGKTPPDDWIKTALAIVADEKFLYSELLKRFPKGNLK